MIGPSLSKSDTSNTAAASATPLPEKRDKVVFGLNKTPSPTKSPGNSDGKRIVMQIKNGKVTTYERSPNGKSKIVNGDKVNSRLVPYGDDSESDDEHAIVNGGKRSLYVNGKNQILQDMRESEKQRNDHRVVFDKKLNATTSVPGNAHLLETTLKQKGEVHENSNRQIDGLNLMVNKTKDCETSQDRSKTYIDDNGILCISANSGGKVKATSSNWQVDCAPSPSVGSCSSRESVNSTSGWHIKDKSDAPNYSKVPDRQYSGWKVSDETETKHTDITKEEASDSSLSAQVKKLFAASREDGYSKYETNVYQGKEGCDPFFQNKTIGLSERQPLLADVDTEGIVPRKKHKKHKKHKREHRSMKYDELVNESSSSPESHKKHKKKKHKHKKERKHSKQYNDSDEEKHGRKHKRSYDDSEEDSGKEKRTRLDGDSYVWVEKTKDSLKQSKSDSSGKSQFSCLVKYFGKIWPMFFLSIKTSTII